MSSWNDAFSSRADLNIYEDNGLSLFALALRFGVEDLITIAGDAITDGFDDKKCDLVYINNEDEYAVIAQCYKSSKEKASAPANKASDLNTGVAWLLQREIEDVPDRIKSQAQALREGIQDKTIKNLYIWYVHNLPESSNVQNELKTVEQTTITILKAEFPESKVLIHPCEVGDSTLTNWYEESLTPILVNEKFEIECGKGYEQRGEKWSAFSTSIPATFLYRTYKKHKTNIFSANIRDYLGARSSDSNINNGIRKTIENDPENFWVYNNGVTILTHSFQVNETRGTLEIKGFSIVNGAQTTGAIGSLNKLPEKAARVQARFVSINNGDEDLIHKIIRFNNSQNKVEASDFRSTDKFQKRLKEEFVSIPNAEYEGGRRGGAAEAIQRRSNLLPSYTVGQALACFHQEPIVAYNQKTAIWVEDRLYSKYFNEQTKATHIVCAFSLLRAVENKKREILLKKTNLTEAEENYLSYFRKRGSIFLLASSIASCLETILGKKINSIFKISFGVTTSPSEAEVIWDTIINVTLPFCQHLAPALDTGGMKNTKVVTSAMQTFKSLVQATATSNREIYRLFGSNISFN